jgi:hypothetical protein
MKKDLSLRQRIHNAAGSQAVENCHARHCYYHARANAAEEWGNIWSKRDDVAWGHAFGRMRGYESVYRGSVTNYDAIVYDYYLKIYRRYPQIGGKDPRPLAEVSMHVLDTDVIEVAGDGMSARAAFYTPGVIFCNYTPEEKKRFHFVWERYGSDFIYDDGQWLYLHEQVCPEFICALDCENWAYKTYTNLVKALNPHEQEILASGREDTRPKLDEPGPLHFEYSPIQPVQNTVPWPEPYATHDENNTYVKSTW